MKKILLISTLIIVSSLSFYSQEKPMRIGVKVGVPEVAGLNLEYVSPLLNSKLAPSIDFTRLSIQGGEFVYSNFGIGANYYFGDSGEGKGLYSSLMYSRPGFKLEGNDGIESSLGKVALNMFSIKLGAKLGKGFYFRPEIGYAIVNSAVFKVEYSDASTGTSLRVESEPIPINLGGIVANIGIGFSF
jgi:hypothetical protein